MLHTKGGLQLDLEWAGRRWGVSLGQEVWELHKGEDGWHPVDLQACCFQRRNGEAKYESLAG